MTAPLLEQIACWPWAEATVILFGFAWGAMLGSFINVVVHRLPRGESVVTRRSRCPRCRAAIRPSDNVPVLGWLWLGGRCRDCGARIAITYPLVEGFCGLLVAMLAAVDLVAGGRSLSTGADQGPPGIDRLLRGDWSLLVAFVLHAGVVLSITCWSLLDAARGAESDAASEASSVRRLWLPLMLTLTTVAAVPAVGPSGVLPAGGAWPAGVDRLAALAAAAAGSLAGWVLAWLTRGVASPGRGRWPNGFSSGLPLLGSVLGWQMLTIVAAVTVVTVVGCRGRRRTGGMAALPGLVLAVAATLAIAFQGPFWAAWKAACQTVPGPSARATLGPRPAKTEQNAQLPFVEMRSGDGRIGMVRSGHAS